MAVLAVLVALTFSGALMSPASAGNGNAGTSDDVSSAQPESKADKNEGGANGQCTEGPYCSTRDGSESENGSDVGEAKGKPCAGCVGKADNKNPQGQKPGGSDNNAGYECDRNQGVGQGNPAHTGCTPGSETPDEQDDTKCTPGKDADCTPPVKDDEDEVVVVVDTKLPSVDAPVDTTVDTTGTGVFAPAEIAGVEMERAQLVNGAGSTVLAQSGSAVLPQTGAAANLAALTTGALGLVLAGALAMSRQRRSARVNS